MADRSEMFAPLTADDLSARADETLQDEAAREVRPSCPPADHEPGERIAAKLLGRDPGGVWRYTMPDGATAFYIARMNRDGGGKDFIPLSWFEGEGGGWRKKAWPAPRPVYRLDAIAANPGAAIVICEGEKAADAAARVFPRSIVTTSSGGAQAPDKTDWTSLARRQVLIWPDHDEAGLKYAREVAAILAAQGCNVSVIDAAALVAIDP